MVNTSTGTTTALPSLARLSFFRGYNGWGEPLWFTGSGRSAFHIGGSTYYRIRDIAQFGGFSVNWLPETDTIYITTD